MVTPLTLTLLAEAFPAAPRDGARRVVGHLRLGGRARPAGRRRRRAEHLVALDLLDQRPDRPRAAAAGRRALRESHGPNGTLDLRGLALASAGAFGIVFGIVRAQSLGWTSTTILALAGRAASSCWPRSSRGSAARASRCCRCHSSPAARSRSPTSLRSQCTSGCSGRSSFSLSSCRTCWQQPPGGGAEDPRVDRRHDGRRAVRGRLLRALRQPPVHAPGLALQAGALAWLASILSTDRPTGR